MKPDNAKGPLNRFTSKGKRMTRDQEKDLSTTLQNINLQKFLKQQDQEYADALRAKFADKE
jgi:hypothetical protein